MSLHAQYRVPLEYPVRIDSIEILGNVKTDAEVLLREIPWQFPADLESEDFIYIQNRLSNLFLFNRVILTVAQESRRNILVIQVTEMWYLYPVPIFFLNDQEWDRASYGFSISHFNFRGRNEKLSVGGWLGYNPSYFIIYRNPWVGKNSRLTLDMELRQRRVRNKFYDLEENRSSLSPDIMQIIGNESIEELHRGGRISIGKRLDLHQTVTVSAGIRNVRFEDGLQSLTISGTSSDWVPTFGLRYRADYRNLFEYPTSGGFLSWQVRRNGLNDDQPQFWRWDFDHRAYLPLHNRLSFAARNLMRLNSGDLPFYDRVFFGFSDRIRGYFDTRSTARHMMLQSYELRFKILPFRYFSMKQGPPMAAKFVQQLKYGVSMGLFLDSGIVWNSGREFSFRNHNSGYGIGLHLHLPYIYLLRIEHAWSDSGNREWLIIGGVSF